MPPVFKTTKGYDPALAKQTLTVAEPENADDATLSMLRELGLEDEAESLHQTAEEQPSPSGAAEASSIGGRTRQLLQQLEDRTAAVIIKLQQGNLTRNVSAEAQEVMLDLQHQVELLSRGNSSLRTSIKGIRDAHQEATAATLQGQEEQQRRLQQQLEELQSELQQAQAANSDHQQQQALLKAEAVQLRTRATQLQGQIDKLQAEAASAEALQLKLKEQQARVQQLEQQVAASNASQAQQQQQQQQQDSQAAANLVAELAAAKQQADQLQLQVSAITTERNTLQQQLSSLTKDREDLQQQVEKLQTAAKNSQEAAAATDKVQLEQLQQQLDACKQELGDQKALVEHLQQQLDAKAASCTDLEVQLRQAEEKAAKAGAATEASSELAAKVKDLEQQLSAAEQQATSDSERHKQALADLQAKHAQQLAASQSNSKETESLQKSLQQLEQDLGASRQAAQEQQQAAATLQEKFNAVESERKELQQQMTALQVVLDRKTALHASALQEAQEQAAMAQKELQAAKQQLQELQEAGSASTKQLQEQVARLQQQLQDAAAQVTELSKQCDELAEAKLQLDEQRVAQEAQIGLLQQQEEIYKAQLQQSAASTAAAEQAKRAAERQAANSQSQVSDLEAKLMAASAESAKARNAAATLQQELDQVRQEAEGRVAAAAAAAATAQEQAQREAAVQVEAYMSKWKAEYEKRRKLHNMVVELKGNIRVLARIRPLLEKERVSADGSSEPVQATSQDTLLLASLTGSPKEYEFDRVFAPEDGQEQVFDEVSALVGSLLDGYNVTIFAYGQTGAGKTFTMEGTQDNPGINTRALRELFRLCEDRREVLSCAFSASVLEIYNEQIFDLLAGGKDSGDKLDVKEGPDGMYVPGLRQEPVRCFEEVVAVLQKGKQARSTFATNMNEHSSRSHLVLSVYAVVTNTLTGATYKAKLHLIDLAGSERVSRSGAEGDRLKEAAAINKSLSALGDVVAALQQRSAHVPYRNSKLTRLLEDGLGGNSKTILVVNCSPALENVSETRCSLDFAVRARKVELGAARRNVVQDGGGSGGEERLSTTVGPSPPRTPVKGAMGSNDAARLLAPSALRRTVR